MRRLALCFLLLASVSHADTLRMKRVDSTNLHMANQRGARHWTDDYSITLELGAKGKASVTSKGMRSNHDMDVINNRAYNTEDRAKWTTTWRGTWSIKADTLTLVLDLVKHDCKAEKDDNGNVSVEPCKIASAKATLECTSSTIDLENRTTNKSTKAAAWVCSPGPSTELAESAGTLIFAKSGCVEVNGGHMTSNSFARCP